MWWRWKCKPLSWLWGLIPLALLGFMAIYSERSSIESDLKVRGMQALRNAGMDWAEPSFTGRDGVIFGKALTPDEKIIALDALRDVYGVRIAKDDSSFLRAVSPYIWSAETEKRKLILKGYVTSSADRKDVMAQARDLFPRLTVVNNMQIAPGNPKRVDWKASILYSLQRMKDIKKGSVHLEDRSFTIKGDAIDSKSFVSLNESLDTTLPEGLRLQENLVNPPLKNPYVWRARKDEDKISLTGYVSSQAMRNKIADMIQRKFPNHTIDDNTSLASGEPKEWQKVLRLSLTQLSILDYGEAKIANKRIKLSGRAPSESLAKRVTNDMNTIFPKGYRTVNEVIWRKTSGDASFGSDNNRSRDTDRGRDQSRNQSGRNPFDTSERDRASNDYDAPSAGAKVISPYLWSLTKKNDGIILGGYVSSEKMRDQMLQQAKHTFPDYQIIDNMVIGAGGLGEIKHMMVADYAFQRLATLAYGTLTLRNNKVRLSGEARENSFKPEDLSHSLLPRGVVLANARIRPAKISNYNWEVARNGNDIILSGYVRDKAMKNTILQKAKRSFPSLNVQDKMKAASGVPDGLDWLDAMTFCLKQLDGLKQGVVGLRNRGFHLVGTAWSFEDQKKLNLAKAYIPAGFNLDYLRIELPKITPYITRLDYQAQRVTLSGYAPNQKTKDNLIIYIEERFPGATVLDQVEIAGGANLGWADNIKAGIYAVSRLTRGSATLIDTDMAVRGVASNDFVKKEIGRELVRALGRDIGLENRVRVERDERSEGQQADFTNYNSRNKSYGEVTEAELNSSERVKASTCERYLNTLVNRTSINFSAASAKLQDNSYDVLKKLAFVANRCEEASIEIAGHTDSDGSKKFNHFLSLKRARSVAEFLVDRGVDKDRLVAVGYGETRPVVANNSAKNKAINRRIEFVVKDRF